MSPTRAPRPSTIAFVTTVVPWATEARGPPPGPTAVRPFRTPWASSAGVVGTLQAESRPEASRATRSVKVPPTSMPTLLRDDVGVEPLHRSWRFSGDAARADRLRECTGSAGWMETGTLDRTAPNAVSWPAPGGGYAIRSRARDDRLPHGGDRDAAPDERPRAAAREHHR